MPLNNRRRLEDYQGFEYSWPGPIQQEPEITIPESKLNAFFLLSLEYQYLMPKCHVFCLQRQMALEGIGQGVGKEGYNCHDSLFCFF